MQEKTMKKLMNFRYFFVLALSLILVICFCINVFRGLLSKGIITIAMLILCIVIFYLYKKRKSKNLIITFSICVCIALTFANIFARQAFLNSYNDFDGEDVAISARISSNYSKTSKGNIKIVITNIKISSNEKATKINGKIDLYIDSSNLDLKKLEVGSYFETKATINFYKLTTLTNKNKISNGILGYAFSRSSDFKILKTGRMTLKESVNNFVYEKLCKWNLSYAGLGLAMIFGNTAFIGSDINEIFSNIGIAHLVAVSGLNISILIGIFTFILKKFKYSVKTCFFVNLVALTFYSYFCGFTISVVRASLMALISQYAKLRGLPYDNLSTISFVASLILMVNPLMIFNYSYILSFSTVLTITLLFRKFKEFFDKFFYKSFSESLSLTLSVQSWLVFVQIYLFKTFPLVSLISNCIVVPVAVFAFEYLLITTPISLILPFLSFLTKGFDILMGIVVKFGNFLNSFGLIIRIDRVSLALVALSFLALFIFSDYFFENKKRKNLYISVVAVIAIISQLIFTII